MEEAKTRREVTSFGEIPSWLQDEMQDNCNSNLRILRFFVLHHDIEMNQTNFQAMVLPARSGTPG